MNRINKTICMMAIGLLISAFVLPASGEDNFTQSDRERLVRLEATQTVFMQQVDKRFEQVDKRFEELRADVNTRFEELRADMNKRFEEQRADTNTRFEQLTNMFYTISAIFTSLFATVFGFAWWDRRSVVKTAKKAGREAAREEVYDSTQEFSESAIMLRRVLEVLKKFAEKTPDLKELMSRANLL